MIFPSPADIAASRAPLRMDALAGIVGPTRQLSRLEVVAASPSTNTALVKAAGAEPEEWPHFSALIADHQTAGRGRAGRDWATPQGAALTVSFVLRPAGIAPAAFGWAPLVVGLAVVRALRDVGTGAYLKWPNDVVVEAGAKDIPGWGRWRKAVGILCEVVPGQQAIVAGIGINVSQSSAELPVPHAASLASLGAAGLDRVRLMRELSAQLRDAVAAWEGAAMWEGAAAGGGDVGGGGTGGKSVRPVIEAVCATIGWDVVVDVPGGDPVTGRAVGLADGGALRVETAAGVREVLAGDVRVRRT